MLAMAKLGLAAALRAARRTALVVVHAVMTRAVVRVTDVGVARVQADAVTTLAGRALAACVARLAVRTASAADVVIAVVCAAIVAVGGAVAEAACAVPCVDGLLSARLTGDGRAVASVDVGVGDFVDVKGEVYTVAGLALGAVHALMAAGRARDVVTLFEPALHAGLAVTCRAQAVSLREAAAALGLGRLAAAGGAARGRRVGKAVA